MYETLRIVADIKPKYVVWENVKNILSKKHFHNFQSYLDEMERLGYDNYYQILNAKDYGIPQNRERVFTISIRKFEFPEKEELKIKLSDMLEDVVDEKWYLDDKQITKIQNSDFMQERTRIQDKDYCDTILARDYKDAKCVKIKNNTPLVLGGIGEKDSNNGQQWKQQNRIYDNNVSISVTTCYNPNYIDNDLRIRKLTPKECWRLMGFDDSDIEKCRGISNTQLYKQAGNSIVVNVLEKVLGELL